MGRGRGGRKCKGVARGRDGRKIEASRWQKDRDAKNVRNEGKNLGMKWGIQRYFENIAGDDNKEKRKRVETRTDNGKDMEEIEIDTKEVKEFFEIKLADIEEDRGTSAEDIDAPSVTRRNGVEDGKLKDGRTIAYGKASMEELIAGEEGIRDVDQIQEVRSNGEDPAAGSAKQAAMCKNDQKCKKKFEGYRVAGERRKSEENEDIKKVGVGAVLKVDKAGISVGRKANVLNKGIASTKNGEASSNKKKEDNAKALSNGSEKDAKNNINSIRFYEMKRQAGCRKRCVNVDMNDCPEPPGTSSESEEIIEDGCGIRAKDEVFGSRRSDSGERKVMTTNDRFLSSGGTTVCKKVAGFSVTPSDNIYMRQKRTQRFAVQNPFPTISLRAMPNHKNTMMALGTPLTPTIPEQVEGASESDKNRSTVQRTIDLDSEEDHSHDQCGEGGAQRSAWRLKLRRMGRKRVQQTISGAPPYVANKRTNVDKKPRNNGSDVPNIRVTPSLKLHPFCKRAKSTSPITPLSEAIDIDNGSVMDVEGSEITHKRGAVQTASASDSEGISGGHVKKRPRCAFKKQYHPFFNARLGTAKCHAHRATELPLVVDAWASQSATMSFGYEAPSRSSTSAWAYSDVVNRKWRMRSLQMPAGTNFRILGDCDAAAKRAPERRWSGTTNKVSSPEQWSEKYRKIHEVLRTIHAFQFKKLVTWLQTWYVSGDQAKQGSRDSDMTDGSQYFTSECDSDDDYRQLREGVVLLTGPVGVGKSAMVYQAAEKLGLDVLEINASSCRSAQRLNGVLKEAMSVHRLNNKARISQKQYFNQNMQNNGCTTLILFEEVDLLFDDEKGFWNCIEDLALASDAKCPLVMTANKITTAMELVLGDSPSEAEQEIAYLLRNTTETKSGISRSFSYNLMEVDPPSERQVHAALEYIARCEKLNNSKPLARIIASLHAKGDLRSAVNDFQFWSRASDPKEEEIDNWRASLVLMGFGHLTDRESSLPEAVLKYPLQISQIGSDQWTGTKGAPGLQTHITEVLTQEMMNMPGFESLQKWADHFDCFSMVDCLISENLNSVNEADEWDGVHGLRSTIEIASTITSFSLASLTKQTAPANEESLSNTKFVPLLVQAVACASQGSMHDPFDAISRAIPTRRVVNTDYLPTLRSFARSEQAFKEKEPPEDCGEGRPRRHRRRLSHFYHLRLGAMTQRQLLTTFLPSKS